MNKAKQSPGLKRGKRLVARTSRKARSSRGRAANHPPRRPAGGLPPKSPGPAAAAGVLAQEPPVSQRLRSRAQSQNQAQGPGAAAENDGHGAAGVARLLDDREWTHGNFSFGAEIAQALKDVIRGSEGYGRLSPTQREALDLDCPKTARILAGNPHHPDHWTDKAGYATLISAELEEAALPDIPW